MKKKNSTIYLLIMFVGLLLILGGFIYSVFIDNDIDSNGSLNSDSESTDNESLVSVPYLKVNIEEGGHITDNEIGYKEIDNLEYNNVSNEIFTDENMILNKCSSKDLKAGSYFYIADLVECSDNETDDAIVDSEVVCNEYKKYPDDGSDNLVTLDQYNDKQNISKLEKVVNLFGGLAFTNNSNCDYVSVFEYIGEGNKVIFNNFKDENALLLLFLNYYFENVGKNNVKTTKCNGDSGECYILPINDVKKYSKTLFNFNVLDEHLDSFGYKDSNNYYIGTDLSHAAGEIENKGVVSIGIDSKTKDIHYKNKYFVYGVNKEMVVNYVFKLNDEGNYYLYSMGIVK